MADKTLRDFFFASIIFTVIIVGVVSAIALVKDGVVGDYSTAHPGLINDSRITEFNRTFNIQQNVTQDIEALQDDLNNLRVENDDSIVSVGGAFISTSWNMIKFIGSSFSFMNSAIDGIAAYLHLPSWLITIVGLALTAFIIFTVLTAIFGSRI